MAFRMAESPAPIDKLFQQTEPERQGSQKTGQPKAQNELDKMSKEERTKVIRRNFATLRNLIARKGKVITSR